MKGPAKSTRSTSKLTQWQTPVTVTPIPLIQTNALLKFFSERPSQENLVASADAHTATVTAQPMELHAASVAIRITGLSNVEAPGGGTVQLVAHPPQEGHRIDRDASSGNKPNKGRGRGGGGNAKQKSTPKRPGNGCRQGRRQTLQDEHPNSYWSFQTTTPSQS